jgi:hypothetical protein
MSKEPTVGAGGAGPFGEGQQTTTGGVAAAFRNDPNRR